MQLRFVELLESVRDDVEETEIAFKKRLVAAIGDVGINVADKVLKLVVSAAAQSDARASAITDRKGNALPDPDLRDQENVPLRPGFLRLDETHQSAALVKDADDYLRSDIIPWVCDAWVDHSKTKLGFEIPFNRYFYTYKPPRNVSDIDVELESIEEQIRRLTDGLVQ